MKLKMIAAPAALALVVFASPLPANARSWLVKDVIVTPLDKLPAAAKQSGESIFLHTASWETTYLYMAHNQGKQIAILDVTSPDKMKFRAEAQIDAPGAVRFRTTTWSKCITDAIPRYDRVRCFTVAEPQKAGPEEH
ncbi:MAG TPA: hypothetical protein VK638_30900 [Edaphobacter sp.]|nr:hypothetical protein [Edaphobacter sp.]